MKDFGLKKLYYSISEVSKITDLEQYVLRYWENEFEELKPGKNRAGNRIYTNKDIKLINLIKKLLRDEKYTIDGAKKIVGAQFLNNNSENQLTLEMNFDEEEFRNGSKENIEVPQNHMNTELTTATNETSNNQDKLKSDLIELKSILQYIRSRL